MALAVALFLPQHPLVQPVAELLFTLPLLLLFIRFVAPSMRQLSHYPASVQCQFGIVPLVGYLFDYITHVSTSLLSEANPAAVEFMFFVCCALQRAGKCPARRCALPRSRAGGFY